jgi:phenylalanyl-tRNA synthetase beta chain
MLTLLNGQKIELENDVLLITDASGPIAMAGIMGGAATEVDAEQTCDLFLESAFFNPTSIAGRARRFGLHTDASHRFERGVDPALQALAVERATRLLIDIGGGEPGPTIDTLSDQHPRERSPIRLRASRVRLLLGIDVTAGEVADILQRLGMLVNKTDEGWQVTPPSFRFDITMEHDLIEEIGRIHGYNRLPIGRPATHLQIPQIREGEVNLARLRSVLVQRGFREVITYSFVDETLQQLLDPEQAAITLANPISADMAVMRTSLWPGLLKALLYNQKRQQTRIRLFESGLNFQGSLEHLQQLLYIGGIAAGNAMPEQWGLGAQDIDFFDIKGDVEALLDLSGEKTGQSGFHFGAAAHPALHPGQTARIERNGVTVGWVGALHPGLARDFEIEGRVFLFELALDGIRQARVPRFAELSKFPASRRDLAIVVEETVTAQQLESSIRELGGDLLRDTTLFDVYRGKGISEGQKSLTFGLILQDFSRNLTDQSVDELINAIITGLHQRHGAQLRV